MAELLRQQSVIHFDSLPMATLEGLLNHEDTMVREKAAYAYVERILNMELERRIEYRHCQSGWQSVSPIALIGLPRNDNISHDQMLVAFLKGIIVSEWHDKAKAFVGQLSKRRQIAVLIRTAKQNNRRGAVWSKSYDEIAKNICYYNQLLGFEPNCLIGDVFKSGESIRKASENAFKQLLKICIIFRFGI